jgi:hypothetical protein
LQSIAERDQVSQVYITYRSVTYLVENEQDLTTLLEALQNADRRVLKVS